MAVIAAPVLEPFAGDVLNTFGDIIAVEVQLTTDFANDLVTDKLLEKIIPIHSKRLETTAFKVLLITLKYEIAMTDAALGFYRSSIHKWVMKLTVFFR